MAREAPVCCMSVPACMVGPGPLSGYAPGYSLYIYSIDTPSSHVQGCNLHPLRCLNNVHIILARVQFYYGCLSDDVDWAERRVVMTVPQTTYRVWKIPSNVHAPGAGTESCVWLLGFTIQNMHMLCSQQFGWLPLSSLHIELHAKRVTACVQQHASHASAANLQSNGQHNNPGDRCPVQLCLHQYCRCAYAIS